MYYIYNALINGQVKRSNLLSLSKTRNEILTKKYEQVTKWNSQLMSLKGIKYQLSYYKNGMLKK